MKKKKYKRGNVSRIVRDGEIMRYQYKPGNVTDYLTYDETLYKILGTYGVSPYLDTAGRVILQLQAGKEHRKYSMHSLAYACYHGYISSYETWEDDMQSFLDWKQVNSLTVDHADNNGHNNTVYNLSLMTGPLNTAKGTIIPRIKEPIYLNCAYCNGAYRVQMMFITGSEKMAEMMQRFTGESFRCRSGIAGIHFLCNDAESFVQCLKVLTEQRFEWAAPLKDNGKWIKRDSPCWCQNVHNSLQAQKVLSQLDEKLFQPFV